MIVSANGSEHYWKKRRLRESAPITGGECFHPLLFSAAPAICGIRVPEFLAAPRVEVRTEKPVWGSKAILPTFVAGQK